MSTPRNRCGGTNHRRRRRSPATGPPASSRDASLPLRRSRASSAAPGVRGKPAPDRLWWRSAGRGWISPRRRARSPRRHRRLESRVRQTARRPRSLCACAPRARHYSGQTGLLRRGAGARARARYSAGRRFGGGGDVIVAAVCEREATVDLNDREAHAREIFDSLLARLAQQVAERQALDVERLAERASVLEDAPWPRRRARAARAASGTPATRSRAPTARSSRRRASRRSPTCPPA